MENRGPVQDRCGFTLIEMMVSLAVLCLLFGTIFSIVHETFNAIGDNEADVSAQAEANAAFERLTEVLRESGWNVGAGVTYPRVLAGGSELEFRVLKDLDGNGYPFSESTGELEFGPKVYRIRSDGSGNLRIFDGATPVLHLCRGVRALTFATYLQDPTLQMREIRVNVETRKTGRRGDFFDSAAAGSIDMRN
jgi:prepilin-type N-terminal cleavage/methylation domain-containing protein